MAVEVAQPSPTPSASMDSNHEPSLEEQLLDIRSQITKTIIRRNRIRSSILGSTRIQKCVQARKTYFRDAQAQNPSDARGDEVLQTKLEKAIEKQQRGNDIYIHRLAYGITAFPFIDDTPERTGEPTLTGVRFDIGRTKFEAHEKSYSGNSDAYYVVLRRVQQHKGDDGGNPRTTMVYLKVHHHTIPAHIDLESLISTYLPLPEALQDTEAMDVEDGDRSRSQSESFNDDSGIDITQDIIANGIANKTTAAVDGQNGVNEDQSATRIQVRDNGQNVHKFIFTIRDALQAWHYRWRSIAHIRESVGLPPQLNEIDEDQISVVPHGTDVQKYSISDLRQTNVDALQIRVVWNDDALGLLKVSHDGVVERAVVYGVRRNVKGTTQTEDDIDEAEDDEPQHERLHDFERMLTFNVMGEKLRVHQLVDGLRRCEKISKDG